MDLLLAHQAGDESRALRRAGQILFISRCLDQQPSLISHLVANGVAMLGVERIHPDRPDINDCRAPDGKPSPTAADPAQVTALIDTLLSQDADNAGLARSMRAESCMMQLDGCRTAMVDGKLGADQIRGLQAGQHGSC